MSNRFLIRPHDKCINRQQNVLRYQKNELKMNDVTDVLTDHTKRYNIPLDHIEHRYIQHCTDGAELERIYKELIDGEVGTHPLLVQLTLDRIQNIQPNSEILQQNKLLFNTSQHTNGISSPTTRDNHLVATSSVINNNNHQRIVPKSDAEWEKHIQNVSREFNSDDENEQSKNECYETNKQHIAKQHRLNANTAFKSNNYQQSIDFYTKSLALEKNLTTYFNRAIAYFKLDHLDESIEDCSQIISIDSNHSKAVYHRAVCYCAKQQYDEAKRDLHYLLTIDPDNHEAQDLLNQIFTIQNMNSNQITGNTQSSTITSFILPSLDIEDELTENKVTHSTNMNNPFESDSQITSSSTFNDHGGIVLGDDEGIALGDEAGSGLITTLSDEDEHVSHSVNVSPTMEDSSDIPELIHHNILQTPPTTPLLKKTSSRDQNIEMTIHGNNKRNSLSTISYNQTNDDHNDLYENYNLPTISNQYSTHRQNTNSWSNHNDTNTHSTMNNDIISNSNFSSIIQSWLRDSVTLQSNRHSSSMYGRPWSRSSRPWSLEKIQCDIERFSRFDEYENAIEVSKKMLQNGILDYHCHTEHIVETLLNCAECYLKLNDYTLAIQYATEALQYDKNNSDTLICRAKAFEKEKFLLFSYADYARVPTHHFNSDTAQHGCERLSIELNATEDKTWREKLPTDQNDDERCLTYLKLQNNFSEHQSYEWYRTYADQFYLNACFVLAIRCYTYCIELQPTNIYAYSKRAVCYLKVFEPQKAIDDCDIVLKDDKTNSLALYRKASAYKISRDDRLYELTLKEYLKIQPHNQIVLAEYYKCRYEPVPRKKRRIRTNSLLVKIDNENSLSYEELEQIRAEESPLNSLFNLENSTNIKEQCSFLLHSFQTINLATKKLIEIIGNITRIMIQAEQEHTSIILPFSYIKYCFNILIQLTTLPQLDVALSMIDENSRKLLDDLLEYYSSIFNEGEKLNRLKVL